MNDSTVTILVVCVATIVIIWIMYRGIFGTWW